MTAKTKAKIELDRQIRKASAEKLQLMLRQQLRAYKITEYQEEFKFHPLRKWRYDFYFPEKGLVVDLDGGIHMFKGGHNTGRGIQNDRDKDEAALLMDFTPYRATTAMVQSGQAIQTIIILLNK